MVSVAALHELVVCTAELGRSELGRAPPGGSVSGLREATAYVLEVTGDAQRLYVDDIPLVNGPAKQFAWASSFFAGRVEVIAVDTQGRETAYYLNVAPASKKVHEDQFAAMIAAIRQFDQRLLLGETAACLGFGKAGSGGKLDVFVRWERLRRYGKEFLTCVDAITRTPHAHLKSLRQALPLARVKRLPSSALQDKRLVALATGQFPEGENLEALRVHVHAPTATLDTPANQAICALLKRFQQALVGLQAWVMDSQDELTKADASGRRQRRLAILRTYETEVRRLLRCHPFRNLQQTGTTAAGLTQVAANPTYARAYRLGTEALRLGVNDHSDTEHLRISPSWGVYETWCYVALVEALAAKLHVEFKPGRSQFADTVAELALSAQLSNGCRLGLLFQTTFRSDGLSGSKQAWSLSRERRPDIVLIASHGNEHRTFILDAKYRSGRSSVLEAMESAHIYHDSLFLAGRRPDLCLLLLPGNAELESLEKHETWLTYGVGTISDYSVGAKGIHRCVAAISTWLYDAFNADSSVVGSGS